MSLDGFSMRPLVRELNAALAGGRIDKITQPNKQSVILSVRQPGQNYLLHISINSQNPSAHLLEKNMENPPEPPVFCMVLRKQLETGRIAGIRQHGLDRLLLMDVDSLAGGGKIITRGSTPSRSCIFPGKRLWTLPGSGTKWSLTATAAAAIPPTTTDWTRSLESTAS